jgi:DNA-binding NarL/FixJ family response regulator
VARSGASAYLVWSETDLATVHGCLAAMDAGLYVVTGKAAAEIMKTAEPESQLALSERQLEVLEGLASELTDEQIARKLGRTLRTVRRIVGKLEERFEVRTRFALGRRTSHLDLDD